MFDEQPDGDPHGECAAEIHRLQAALRDLRDAAEAVKYVVLKPQIYTDEGTREHSKNLIAAIDSANATLREDGSAQGDGK
jgi:hypothetical protein